MIERPYDLVILEDWEKKQAINERRFQEHVAKVRVLPEPDLLKYGRKHKRLIEMFCKGYTQRKIADAYGVTPQRIQQIEWKLGLVRPRIKGEPVKRICDVCGNEFLIPFSQRKNNRSRQCSPECRHKTTVDYYWETHPDEWRKVNNERTKRYYHSKLKGNPEFKALTKIRNDRFVAQKKAESERKKAEALEKHKDLIEGIRQMFK